MNRRTPQDLPTLWHRDGRRLPLLDGEVFVRTEGDPDAQPPLLLLHGFPTSSHDFARAWGRLARHHPLVTLDFLGFGVSDKPATHGYSLFEQADVVVQVLARLGVRDVHIVAHDMGTSVACELLARRERGMLPGVRIRSLTLSNGSVLQGLAHLTPAQRLLRLPAVGDAFARLSSFEVFRRTMRSLAGDASLVDDDELRTAWALIERSDGRQRLPRLLGYVDERLRFEDRWIGALRRLDLPTLLLWGARDPVAIPAIAEELARLIRGSRLRRLPLVGHYPQLEDPGAFAGEILEFVGDLREVVAPEVTS